MKKICLLAFIMMAPCAFSIIETSIYQGTVLDGGAVEANEKDFSFKFDFASKQAMVESEYGNWFIPENECKIRNNIDICISNITFAYRNATTILDVYKSEVHIYTITANLDALHSVEPTELLVGEQLKGTVSLENIADIAAEDVKVNVDMPPNLALMGADGCSTNGNSLEILTTISPSKKIICSYNAQAVLSGSFEVMANISYFDGIEEIIETQTASGVVLPPSLRIDAGANLSMEIGSVIDLFVLLENSNEEYDIAITLLSVSFPSAFSVVKKPLEMALAKNKLSWSGSIEKEETKNLSIKIEAKQIGIHPISIDASYTENNLPRKLQYNFPINVSCTCPIIEESGTELFLVNPNPKLTFKEIQAIIDGAIKEYPLIAPQSHIVLGKSGATSVKVQFASQNGERFTITRNAAIEKMNSSKETKKALPKEDEEAKPQSNESQLLGAVPVEENQSSNVTAVDQVITELKKPISAKVILIGGIIVGLAFLLTTVFLLRKKTFKVKGKSLDDIDKELKQMEKR